MIAVLACAQLDLQVGHAPTPPSWRHILTELATVINKRIVRAQAMLCSVMGGDLMPLLTFSKTNI